MCLKKRKPERKCGLRKSPHWSYNPTWNTAGLWEEFIFRKFTWFGSSLLLAQEFVILSAITAGQQNCTKTGLYSYFLKFCKTSLSNLQHAEYHQVYYRVMFSKNQMPKWWIVYLQQALIYVRAELQTLQRVNFLGKTTHTHTQSDFIKVMVPREERRRRY